MFQYTYVLANLIFSTHDLGSVISLEHPFELDLTWRKKIKELDVVRKKRQTLDNLYTSQRISQSTFEYLDKKLGGEASDLEDSLKNLSDNMTQRAQELEKQIGELELSLALLEMHHATGEIDDKTYENPNKSIALNLEALQQEIKTLKSSLLEFVSESSEAEVEIPSSTIEATVDTVDNVENVESVETVDTIETPEIIENVDVVGDNEPEEIMEEAETFESNTYEPSETTEDYVEEPSVDQSTDVYGTETYPS